MSNRQDIEVVFQSGKINTEQVKEVLQARLDIDGSSTSFARGLCSRVYLLEDLKTFQHDVCIKRVLEDDQKAPHSVEREVQCLSLLSSLEGERRYGIIPLLAAIYDQSDPFDILTDLVMPYHPCTLQDLLDEPVISLYGSAPDVYCAKEQRPSLLVAQKIDDLEAFILRSSQVLFDALSFLHSHQIAHRDVKPSNVLIDQRNLSIFLIDFGTCWLPTDIHAKGDDGKGGRASEVGTASYRAPECLFSPLNGYDAFAVDMWQAGVCLSEFFLPLKKCRSYVSEKSKPPMQSHLEWEEALWADDKGKGWSDLRGNFDKIDGHTSDFYGTAPIEDGIDDEDEQVTASGWQREQLFDGSRSDLGLANSIFSLLGLPDSDEEGAKLWPEALHFQPPLANIPFARRPAAIGGLQARLVPSAALRDRTQLLPLIQVLSRCVQLSAANRIDARTASQDIGKAVRLYA